MTILRDDSHESADWIKTLPGYKDEAAIHDSLGKKRKIVVKAHFTKKQASKKIVAQQGSSRYLVDVGNDQGVVVDIKQKIAYKPWNIQSIIARGYWEEYKGDNESEVLGLL